MWRLRSKIVTNWAESQDDSSSLEAIMLSLKLGNDPAANENRSTYWTAIVSIGHNFENFPREALRKLKRRTYLSVEQELSLISVNSEMVKILEKLSCSAMDFKDGNNYDATNNPSNV